MKSNTKKHYRKQKKDRVNKDKRQYTQKSNRSGKGLLKSIFSKNLTQSLIDKKSVKADNYTQMSHKELIESIEILLDEVSKVEELENELIKYKTLFNRDNITTIIAALADGIHFQSRIGAKEETVKIKKEYKDLIRKIQVLL